MVSYKISKNLLSSAAMLLFCAYSPEGVADSSSEIVYFECQPNQFLRVKVMTMADITPVLDKRTFDLGSLPHDQRKQACQISDSVKAIVEMNAAEGADDPKNNNVSVFLNDKLLNNFTFDAPDHSYTYMIMNLKGTISVDFSDGVEVEKTQATHYNPKTKTLY